MLVAPPLSHCRSLQLFLLLLWQSNTPLFQIYWLLQQWSMQIRRRKKTKRCPRSIVFTLKICIVNVTIKRSQLPSHHNNQVSVEFLQPKMTKILMVLQENKHSELHSLKKSPKSWDNFSEKSNSEYAEYFSKCLQLRYSSLSRKRVPELRGCENLFGFLIQEVYVYSLFVHYSW